jgi:hypothetical protein
MCAQTGCGGGGWIISSSPGGTKGNLLPATSAHIRGGHIRLPRIALKSLFSHTFKYIELSIDAKVYSLVNGPSPFLKRVGNTMRTTTEILEGFRLSRFLKIVRETFAILFWAFCLAHIFVLDLIQPIISAIPQSRMIFDYRLLILLFLLSVLWLLLRTRKFISFVGYIVAYPFVIVFWKFPKATIKRWTTLLVFAPAIYDIISKLKINFVLFTLALIGAVAILSTTRPWIITCSMIILSAYLIWHFARRLWSSFSSSTLFTEVTTTIRSLWENAKQLRAQDTLKGLQIGTKEYENAYAQNILNLYIFSTFLASNAARLKALYDNRRVDLYFAASFLYTFMLALLIYSFEYLALSKVDPDAFAHSTPLTIFGFLGYSFGALTHFQISTITPVSDLAHLLTYTEVFSSIMILVLLSFVIFTSARERYRADLDSLVTELSVASGNFERAIQENYELTLRAAESKLLKFNALLVRYLLRVRYGAEAGKQIEEEIQKEIVSESDLRDKNILSEEKRA